MKTNLHIGRKRTVLFEKYNIEHEKKFFLLEMLDGCEMKVLEDFLDYIFYLKSDRILFEHDIKKCFMGRLLRNMVSF